MSVPQIYLVEPYNAYAPKGRKKHISEIIEEQALLERIIAEANSRTLPPQSPPISTPTVGNPAVAAGAGGVPFVAYFAPRMTLAFSPSATTASAPTQINFVNNSSPDLFADGVATFLWNFGDGTTSTDVNPSHTYTTTGSNFAVTLKATSLATGVTASLTQSINVVPPTVTADFSLNPRLGIAPLSTSFTNLSSTNNSQNTLTYRWVFGDGTTSSLANPVHVYDTGSFVVTLQVTGSFNVTDRKVFTGSLAVTASAPTITAAFTVTTSSNSAPATASFSNSTTYNSSGSLTYLWLYGSGSITSSLATPPAAIFNNAGPYTASLQVTESLYNVSTVVTRSWRLA